MSEQSDNELKRKLAELESLNRVLSNGLNWLSDVEIKVAYIQPVSEFIGFLTGFKSNIEQQRAALAAIAPKANQAVSTEKVIEPEVVA